MFLFQRTRVMLADCAFRMVEYARKKTVCEDAIMCAVKVLFARAPNLCDKLLKKFDTVANLVEEAREKEKKNKEHKKASKEKTDKNKSKKVEKASSDNDDSSSSDDD